MKFITFANRKFFLMSATSWLWLANMWGWAWFHMWGNQANRSARATSASSPALSASLPRLKNFPEKPSWKVKPGILSPKICCSRSSA